MLRPASKATPTRSLPRSSTRLLLYTFGQHSDLYQKPRSALNGGHAPGPWSAPETRLFAKLKKYHFYQDEVRFLDYVVSVQGLWMEDERIEAVKNWPEPKSVRDIVAMQISTDGSSRASVRLPLHLPRCWKLPEWPHKIALLLAPEYTSRSWRWWWWKHDFAMYQHRAG